MTGRMVVLAGVVVLVLIWQWPITLTAGVGTAGFLIVRHHVRGGA